MVSPGHPRSGGPILALLQSDRNRPVVGEILGFLVCSAMAGALTVCCLNGRMFRLVLEPHFERQHESITALGGTGRAALLHRSRSTYVKQQRWSFAAGGILLSAVCFGWAISLVARILK